eukprot:UN34336
MPLDGGAFSDVEGDEFEKSMQKLKRKKKKRLSPEEDNLAKELLTKLVRKMQKAADDDRQSNRFQKLAVEKSKLISEVRHYLELSHFHTFMIEKLEVLDVLRDWLMPLPDGCLPELNLRMEVYRIIDLLHLDKYEPGEMRP